MTDALAILTIDLGAIAENWRLLAARAAPGECAAVVKADAYGCGIEAVVLALAGAGCKTFFTAHVEEGARARMALRDAGQNARIFILSGFQPEAATFADYAAYDLCAVIGSAEEFFAWEGGLASQDTPAGVRCALHVDTGMNRLGFPVEEARLLPGERLQAARCDLVMSHLVSAEIPADGISARQIAAFDHARERALRGFPASLSNSSGLFLPLPPVYNLSRPGYALYGGNPTPGRSNPMRPVVTLKARILQLRTVPVGATAGYNGLWTAARPSRLATIGVGYADGLPIGASGIGDHGAVGFIGERPCPILGRISMDLTILDVTDVPAEDLHSGARVELLGPHIGVDDLGRVAGTIGYEILTRLGHRYRRHYVGSGQHEPPAP